MSLMVIPLFYVLSSVVFGDYLGQAAPWRIGTVFTFHTPFVDVNICDLPELIAVVAMHTGHAHRARLHVSAGHDVENLNTSHLRDDFLLGKPRCALRMNFCML